ncbi:MAG: UDP-2,4-diacetamido-2,4,6-trideoxy-beta-L-altropyranose hydrolase [Oligoflexia bacterium]|nr:UDP-2,4-diacetamido-2,4,6-trideoxy-beta-L-altropyranose hydrolase [Oligoflexia bacterium]
MKAVLRADSSAKIGTGHLARDISLIEALQHKNWQVEVISRMLPGTALDLLKRTGAKLHILPHSDEMVSQDEPLLLHRDWLQTSWQKDSAQCEAILKSIKPDWVIVDHYALDMRWEKVIRPLTKGILVIDDLADRHHDCDLLVDHNYYFQMEHRYKDLVGSKCKTLLGPKFALIRTEFREQRLRMQNRSGRIERLLVFMGGIDLERNTEKCLRAIGQSELKDHQIDVIVGLKNPFRAEISECAKNLKNSRIHVQPPNLAPLMAEAHLAIGAPGSTTWERFTLGLPSVLMTVAKNQRQLAEDLERQGLIYYLGESQNVSTEQISTTLDGINRNPQECTNRGLRCATIADGQGPDRIINAMEQFTT